MDNKNPYPKMGEVEKKVVDKTKGMSTKEIAHFYKESADNEILQSGNTSVKFALPETKEAAEAFVVDLITEVHTGNEGSPTALKAYLMADDMEKALKELKKELREDAIKEFDLHSQKTATVFGHKVTKKEAGTTYDYSKTNDAKLGILECELADAMILLDDRQSFLKSLPIEGFDTFDKDTGETFKLYPPIKKSTTTLSISSK